jgi:hypothetical protein
MKTFDHKDETKIHTFYVYRTRDRGIFASTHKEKSTLIERAGLEFVEEFRADAHCDYIMHMVNINDREGHHDPYWNNMERRIAKDGI